MSELDASDSQILERISDGIFALDSKFRFTFLNKKAEELLGIDKKDALGKVIWEECNNENQKPFICAFRNAEKTKQISEVEAYYSTTDIWIYGVIYPSETGYSAYLKDITLRKREEVKIRRILDAAPVVIWATDGKGYIIFAQGHAIPALEDYSYYVGKNAFEIFAEFKTLLDRAIIRKESFTAELFYKGEWFQNTYTPFDTGTLVVSTVITPLKDAERKLQEEKVLREGFVAALTHDIRNPLSAARTLTQLIQKFCLNDYEFVDQLRAKKYLLDIIHHLDRIDSMVQDILDANTIRAGETLAFDKEWVCIKDLVEDTVHTLTLLHGNRFILDIQPIVGNWNYSYVQRALENLISNAIKYGALDKPIKITGTTKGDFLELSVHNYGQPIEEENQHSIFDSYKRTESARKSGKRGWGIGLTLVKGIVEAHGGQVFVKSNHRDGTTFYILLPIKSNN